MKKTQRKDAIRNIWKKKVSWISIVIVTMLTVGVFMGCRFSQRHPFFFLP